MLYELVSKTKYIILIPTLLYILAYFNIIGNLMTNVLHSSESYDSVFTDDFM